MGNNYTSYRGGTIGIGAAAGLSELRTYCRERKAIITQHDVQLDSFVNDIDQFELVYDRS